MPPTNPATTFGDRIRQLRLAAAMSQEQLATRAGLHRTHVSLIERGSRSVRLDTIHQLAQALGVDPAELFKPSGTIVTPQALSPRDELDRLMPFIQEFQALATTHGINDVFQDNGGKLLQTLILLDLDKLPGREGNDAVDAIGNEYELKSVNAKLTRSFTTHHHLNPTILKKYRAVAAWYFSVYENIVLVAIYRLSTAILEPFFTKWEQQWQRTKRDINNPKIPLAFVKANGTQVYP